MPVNLERIDSFTGTYSFLSNFHKLRTPVVCEFRLEYFTVENAYQASKSLYLYDRMDIRKMTPAKAKAAGQRLNLRPDWEEVKRALMMQFLLQKFVHNDDCRKKLLDTGDAELLEGNFWGDVYWGVVNGRGENHLGKLLMGIRRLLQ